MKLRYAPFAVDNASQSSFQELTRAINEALSTIERVRETAMQSKNWPVLNDAKGMRTLMEFKLVRTDLFKHQIWRLPFFGSMANQSLTNTPDMNIFQQADQATTEYESVVFKMGTTMKKLMKRYKFTDAEMLQVIA